ncbi:MAG: Crp/Fnr family transcriptional regulator [Pseudomonadota bacterium]
MDYTDIIGGIPLFEGLPEDRRRDLSSIVSEKKVDRSEDIFFESDPADGFYVVIAGKVKIYKLSPDGKEQILHIFGPGEPFGEVPVFEGRRFPANATALEKSRLLFFPRNRFADLISRNPALAMSMLGMLSRRLRNFTALIDALSLKEVPGRLATHILYLSDREGGAESVDLDMPKGQLAALIGTIPETLSRILARMTQQGFIRSDKQRITICDKPGLADLAEGLKRLQ